MLKVSDAFNSAFAAPDRELRARVTIGKTVYDSDDLTSINYDSGAMTGEQFSIGSTYMNSAKIIFSHLVEGLKQLDEVLVEFGVLKPDGTVEYVKMGTFIVDDKIQMDRNNNTTTIECMDRMTMLGGTYVSKLTYPARIKDVAIEIANMAGVKANETSFARLSENKINQPTGYTYRDAIGLIAQFQMGFALFDRDGLLDIRTLQDNSFKIDPNQYFLKGLVKNETFFKLNGISCTVVTTSKDENGNETSKTTVLQSGSSSGAQIKLANNVMTQDVLDRMYEALKFTNYYPFSLNWNGNPAVEAGDWLTVEDLQGNEFKVPNMSYTLTYNGGLTTTSKADTSVSSPATYSYGGSMSNIVNEIGGRDGTEGNHIYEGTEDQEPALPKEGDLWYKHVGPDTEEWIYRDGKWEFLTSTKPATDAQKAADAAQKEAEEAKKTANESVAAANDAAAEARFANDTATQAKSDAATAGQQAKDALTSAGTAITDAKKALTNSSSAQADSAQARKDSATAAADAVTAKNDAATALTDAKKALTDSGSAQVDSAQARKDSATAKIQAANAATQANQAVTDASTAKADAAAAKGQAANALGQANTAINNAANALDKFNNMQVGGVNLLLDTGFNNLPQYWIARAGTVNGTFNGHNVIYYDAQTITNDFIEVLRQPVYNPSLTTNRVLPNQWYTLSFYAKGTGQMSTYVYGSFVDTSAGSYIDGVKSNYAGSDGNHTWDLTDGWTRHTYTFKSKSSFQSMGVQNVLWRLFKGNTVYITMPQLETGTLATDYSPAPEDVQQQFTNIDGELASKVSQTTYNVLAGTVDTVNTLAKQNQSTISTLATKTSVDTVNHTATTAQTLAQQNANELLNKANSTTVNTLTQRVTTAESTLKQTATTAQLALTQKDIDDLNDTVTTQGLDITAMADGLKLKSDATTVNALSQTVDKQSSQLALTATKAELGLIQTNVDNLKKTVISNTAGMTANANALKLKADSSTVSSLDGRVTNLSGQLDVQADKIAATVTANDVTGMLNGYATQTWTQSQIKSTADQINLSVSKVQSNLDNTQIGSRNLLIGTKDFSKGIYAGNGAVVTSEIYNGNRVLYEPKLTDANSYHNPYNMSTSINADATVYTVSFYAKSDVNGMVTRSYFYSPTNTISSINNQGRSSRTSDGLSELILSNNWEKYWITWTTTPSDSIKHIILGRRDETVANSDIGGIYLTSPMFVEGNKPLPWSPAPEDLVTDVEFAELAVKVDGITATVASKADKTQITQLSDQIKLKADTTALNTLKGTVDKQGSEITLNTNSIKLKADQSSVNTLKDTVDKQGSAIDVNTKAIALRANQSAVDTLTGRVSTAEGKITVQADQIAQTVSKTELTTKLNGYATETWTQSQIKTAADSINLNVSKVRTDLSGTKTQFAALEVKVNGIQTTVSGKADQSQVTQLANSITSVIRTGSQQNMLVNSNFVKDTEGWIFTGSYTAVARDSIYSSYQSTQGIRLSSLENKNPDSYHGFIQQNISANEGTRVSYSSMIRVHTFPERRVYIELLAFDKNNTRIGSSAIEIPKTLSPETWTYFKKDNVFLPTGTTHISLGLEIQGAGDISMAQPMLTQDTEVGPYTPDQVSQTQLTQIQQTIEGVQTTVKNKADQSQVTQLAGQITSSITEAGQLNFVANSDMDQLDKDANIVVPNEVLGWYNNAKANNATIYRSDGQWGGYNGSYGITIIATNSAGTTVGDWTAFRQWIDPTYIGANDVWSFGAMALVTGAPDISAFVELQFFDKDNKVIAAKQAYVDSKKVGVWQRVKFEGMKTPEGAVKLLFGFVIHKYAWVTFSQPMLTKAETLGPYRPDGATYSQMTQLKDQINLRVEKDHIVNQINVSTEGILIAGQKVHITGQTSIDNAVIKDAMIANVKADKITAGTLNAANVNVINLNANNITTGTIKGANLSMNLNTGEVAFQHGRIHSTSNNIDINIDKGYISTADDNTRVMLKNGMLQFTAPGILDSDPNPYLRISNAGSGLNFYGAAFVGRDYAVLSNSANNMNLFDQPIGQAETFSGIATGISSSGWRPTKVGGAERGVIISAGTPMSNIVTWVGTPPSITVGYDSQGNMGGNRVHITGDYVHMHGVYERSNGSSPNMVINPDGAVTRSTSASKYKTDIIRTNKTSYGDKLLELPTATWMDIAEAKRFRDDPVNQVEPTRSFGMIAEDLADAGLEMLVVRGLDGELEGINYDRIGPALIPVIAKLKNKIENLEQKLEEKSA